jgi:hypothetical protein
MEPGKEEHRTEELKKRELKKWRTEIQGLN